MNQIPGPFLDRLKSALGMDNVLTDPADRWPYGQDNSRRHTPPDVVAFATTHAHDRRFFYGVNVEISHQPRLFEGAHWNSEIRPIVGWRWRPLEFIVNPIVDVPLSGEPRRFDFAPAARLAWIVSPVWAIGLEHYADFGPIDRFAPSRERIQELYAVADYSGRAIDVDVGVGRGLTSGSDDWTVKFILGWGF